MEKIALLGAGGKMGVRLARNLKGSKFHVDHVEISDEGRARLRDEIGVDAVDEAVALADADVILMAVPDRLIGKIAHTFIDRIKPGARIIVLDAAAPHAGEMPERADVTFFCTHPCHPALFDFTPDVEAQKDFFGGVHAPQGIVCALIQGPEEDYAACEEIAKLIYAPVARAHRCTLENIAFLEPALSETIGATLALALREATDRAVAAGVPGRPRPTSCLVISRSSWESPSGPSRKASFRMARFRRSRKRGRRSSARAGWTGSSIPKR